MTQVIFDFFSENGFPVAIAVIGVIIFAFFYSRANRIAKRRRTRVQNKIPNDERQNDKHSTKKKFDGKIHIISAKELVNSGGPLQKMLNLVERVYDAENAGVFLDEISSNREITVVYLTIGDAVIGLGCICESFISYGMYELFWGMLDEKYRGNGWGKILIDERLKAACGASGLSVPSSAIVVTKSPWHLTRCGFKVIKKLTDDGEVLMYRKLSPSFQ